MTNLYRQIVSPTIRKKIYNSFLKKLLCFLAKLKAWFIYILYPFFPKNDYYNAWYYIGKYGYTMYPFEKMVNYKNLQVTTAYDEQKKLPYIIHKDKRLYLPENTNANSFITSYKQLLIEQDENSPHRYLKENTELQGKILLDIGAAEGIFTLENIELVKKAYLFECETQWIAPLCATFEPWKEKVEIINKFVGNRDEGDFITIDSFMKTREQNDIHIKMDIEGYELAALTGSKNLLTNGKSISLSICAYHNEKDAEDIASFFEKNGGYKYYFTQGKLLLQPYFMRIGMCRALKTEK